MEEKNADKADKDEIFEVASDCFGLIESISCVIEGYVKFVENKSELDEKIVKDLFLDLLNAKFRLEQVLTHSFQSVPKNTEAANIVSLFRPHEPQEIKEEDDGLPF